MSRVTMTVIMGLVGMVVRMGNIAVRSVRMNNVGMVNIRVDI